MSKPIKTIKNAGYFDLNVMKATSQEMEFHMIMDRERYYIKLTPSTLEIACKNSTYDDWSWIPRYMIRPNSWGKLLYTNNPEFIAKLWALVADKQRMSALKNVINNMTGKSITIQLLEDMDKKRIVLDILLLSLYTIMWIMYITLGWTLLELIRATLITVGLLAYYLLRVKNTSPKTKEIIWKTAILCFAWWWIITVIDVIFSLLSLLFGGLKDVPR